MVARSKLGVSSEMKSQAAFSANFCGVVSAVGCHGGMDRETRKGGGGGMVITLLAR